MIQTSIGYPDLEPPPSPPETPLQKHTREHLFVSFAIPFAILCLHPLGNIICNLPFWYCDKKWQFEIKGVRNRTFLNRVSPVRLRPGIPDFEAKTHLGFSIYQGLFQNS
jgi:hypothetical protein